jgi:hypothetical protein
MLVLLGTKVGDRHADSIYENKPLFFMNAQNILI